MIRAYKAYMAEVTAYSAVELDNRLRGKNGSLRRVEELARTLRDYDPRYDLALWMAMDSPDTTLEEIALQISLLKMELLDVENLPRERIEALRDFCVRASKQFSSEVQEP